MAYLIPIAHLVSHHNRIAASFHYVAIFFLLLRSVCLLLLSSFLHFPGLYSQLSSKYCFFKFKKKKKLFCGLWVS